ncbi:MAG TPA: hypothetical protein VMT73_00350 [Anaerolineales bacterium]|nr:hypothetical protein [Anaerolineales bacterium]
MAEKTRSEKKFESRIPEETRQHFHNARQEFRAGVKSILPEGFFEHGKAARREMLLAWRGMLDAAIQRIDEKE